MVPVLAATGGSCRSTVASLLAHALAPAGQVAVFDLAPRLSSPWPGRFTTGDESPGLPGLDPMEPVSRTAVRAAGTRVVADGDTSWHVLTDPRDWHATPLDLPEQPSAWYQLAAIGGWQAVIADTHHPVGHDVVAARTLNRRGATREWFELPHTVGVLTAAATATGIQALQQTVRVFQADGLPLDRTVVCLVSTSDRRPPPLVRATTAMLGTHVPDVVHVPYDPAIRSQGLHRNTSLHPRTRAAGTRLASAVLRAAHAAWGEPLPDAPRPAPLPLSATTL
jgi:hypothetical protein